jgi:hypothetical protein
LEDLVTLGSRQSFGPTPPDVSPANLVAVLEASLADLASNSIDFRVPGPVVRRHFVEFNVVVLATFLVPEDRVSGIPLKSLVRELDLSIIIERLPSLCWIRIFVWLQIR